LQKPEITTIIRWVLRVVLVFFLTWLIRRRPDDDEEGEDADSAAHESRNIPASRRPMNSRLGARQQQQLNQSHQRHMHSSRRDPFAVNHSMSTMRQRKSVDGAHVDINSVIDKVSKPKDMWEVKKSSNGVDQIIKRPLATIEKDGPDRPLNGSLDTLSGGMVPSLRGGVGGSPPSPNDCGGGSLPPLNGSSFPKPSAAAKAAAKEAREKEAKGALRGHERPVTFITWNRDCNLLFTCGKDKIVCVWSFPDGEQLGVYHGHSGAVWACSITCDSKWLVTSGADRLVIVWEAKTSSELARVELPGVVRFVEWASAVGEGERTCERFVTCHNRFGAHPPALTVWRFDGACDGTRVEELLSIRTLPTPASQVRWGRGDYLLASAHDNGELIFWRADTGVEVRRLPAHAAAISKFDFSNDREVVATASVDKHVKVWDLGKGSEWKLLYEVKTDRPLNAVALGPLSRAAFVATPEKRPAGCAVIAAGGQDARDVAKTASDSEQFGTLMFKMGSAEDFPGELRRDGVTRGHFGPVHTLAFARDGSAIASGSEDGCVRLHTFQVAVTPPSSN